MDELHLHASNPVFHFTDSVCWLEECKYTQLLIWLKYHYLWGNVNYSQTPHPTQVLHFQWSDRQNQSVNPDPWPCQNWTYIWTNLRIAKISGIPWPWWSQTEPWTDRISEQGTNRAQAEPWRDLRPSRERISDQNMNCSQDKSWSDLGQNKEWLSCGHLNPAMLTVCQPYGSVTTTKTDLLKWAAYKGD